VASLFRPTLYNGDVHAGSADRSRARCWRFWRKHVKQSAHVAESVTVTYRAISSCTEYTATHRRRLPWGNGGDWPRRKTPHRAPPCEELDPPYDIKRVLCRKLRLFLAKSTKTAATEAALFCFQYTANRLSAGALPRPHWGSLQRSSRLHSCI